MSTNGHVDQELQHDSYIAGGSSSGILGSSPRRRSSSSFSDLDTDLEQFLDQETSTSSSSDDRVAPVYVRDPLFQTIGGPAVVEYPDPPIDGKVILLIATVFALVTFVGGVCCAVIFDPAVSAHVDLSGETVGKDGKTDEKTLGKVLNKDITLLPKRLETEFCSFLLQQLDLETFGVPGGDANGDFFFSSTSTSSSSPSFRFRLRVIFRDQESFSHNQYDSMLADARSGENEVLLGHRENFFRKDWLVAFSSHVTIAHPGKMGARPHWTKAFREQYMAASESLLSCPTDYVKPVANTLEAWREHYGEAGPAGSAQLLKKMIKSRQRFYLQQMRNSTFMLLPRGDTRWTHRFYLAMASGSVPVLIADGFGAYPYEPFLGRRLWESTAVKLPERLFVNPYSDLALNKELRRKMFKIQKHVENLKTYYGVGDDGTREAQEVEEIVPTSSSPTLSAAAATSPPTSRLKKPQLLNSNNYYAGAAEHRQTADDNGNAKSKSFLSEYLANSGRGHLDPNGSKEIRLWKNVEAELSRYFANSPLAGGDKWFPEQNMKRDQEQLVRARGRSGAGLRCPLVILTVVSNK
eukprot:g12340.t1